MAPLVFTSIETIPRLLLLVVGLLGLIFAIKAKAGGVSGLMVGGFALMLVTTVASIAWAFLSVSVPSWAASGHLGVDEIQLIFLGVNLPLDILTVVSWLLVAIALARSGRRAPAASPMTAPPGYGQPGYPPAQQPPGY